MKPNAGSYAMYIYTHVYSLCGHANADKIQLKFENYTKDVHGVSYLSTAIFRCSSVCHFLSAFDQV